MFRHIPPLVAILALAFMALIALPAAAQAAGPLTLAVLQNTTYPSQFTLSKQAPLREGVYDQRAALGGDAGARNPAAVHFVDAAIDGDRAAVLLSTNTGGSGIFVTLHLVTTAAGLPQAGPGLLLGDRWGINSLTLAGDRATLDVTRHAATDPLCCPTVHDVRTYIVQDNAFVLASSTADAATAPTPPRTGSAGLATSNESAALLTALVVVALATTVGTRELVRVTR